MSTKKRARRPLLAQAVPPPTQQLPRERPGAPGGKRDENRREKVQAICDAALRLFLEHGIEGTRIDEITTAAGVAKGSFYRYFADKLQLTEALLAPLSSAVAAAFERCEKAIHRASEGVDEGARADKPLNAAYTALGLDLGLLVVSHAPAIRLFLQERRGPGVGARAPVARLAALLEERAEALSARARERGLLRPFNARVSSLAVVGAGEQLLFAILSGRDLGDPASEIPALVTSLIMDGLRPG